MNIGSANPDGTRNESILAVAPDVKISIGIRNIIKVPADDDRVRTGIQMSSHSICLVSAQAQSKFQFFCKRAGSLQQAVFCISDDLNITKIFGFEKYGLQMNGKYPDAFAIHINIRINQAFCAARSILTKGLPFTAQDWIPGKNDYAGGIFNYPVPVIARKKIIGEMKLIPDVPDIGKCRIIGFIEFLKAKQIGLLFVHHVQHAAPMTRRPCFFCDEFIPPAHVPGHDPDCVFMFMRKIFPARIHAEECMDILPANNQGYQRNERPSG